MKWVRLLLANYKCMKQSSQRCCFVFVWPCQNTPKLCFVVVLSLSSNSASTSKQWNLWMLFVVIYVEANWNDFCLCTTFNFVNFGNIWLIKIFCLICLCIWTLKFSDLTISRKYNIEIRINELETNMDNEGSCFSTKALNSWSFCLIFNFHEIARI